MKRQLIVTVFAAFLLAGCAHTPRAGEVVMVANTTEAHITLPATGVAVGDKVHIYRDDYKSARARRYIKRLIGEGTVTRLLGDRYAAVEVPAGVEFRERDYAERP